MKIILSLLLVSQIFAGTEGLWRIWRSSFTSDIELITMRDDIALLNSSRSQPPENHSEMFNVSTNTISMGIYEGNYSSSLIIDTDTVEGLINGHPDLEKLSSVKNPLANGWIVRCGTRTWGKNGWIRDEAFDNFNANITDFRDRWKYVVETSTP